MKQRHLPARRRSPAPQEPPATRLFSWDTGVARCWRTTLTVRFQRAGLDVEAGDYLPDRYVAVLGNTRLPATSHRSADEMMPFDLTVAQAAVAQPSQIALDVFSCAALTSLRRRYIAGDPSVCGYFAGPVPASRLR